MSDSSGYVLLMLIGYLLAIVITIVVTRQIFSIPRFLRLQRAQIKLLAEIAKKSNVEPDTVDGILKESEF